MGAHRTQKLTSKCAPQAVLLGVLVAVAFELLSGASLGQALAAEARPARVTLFPKSKPSVTVQVEVVATPLERERGLMFRQSLGVREGMLFLFPRSSHLSFWMRNTFIPLDMIFITAQKRVLGVVENAKPLTEEPREVPGDSQFVLEVVGGFAKERGIGPDTKVEFAGVPKPPLE